MKCRCVVFVFFWATLLSIHFVALGQARLVLNGAKINIANGGRLVIANGAANAITRQSGHIISEGENNAVKWLAGTNTGTYVVPWGLGNDTYLPLTFTKDAGTGDGHFVFSTYGTSWQNSLQLPPGVTNLSGIAQDNSAGVIDRFWQVNAQNYTQKPSLTTLTFSYRDTEHSATGNTIIEPALGAQRWNNQLNNWGDMAPAGEANTDANTVTISALQAADLYPWWTLVDESMPLPLHFLSFTAEQKAREARLTWHTTAEVNVQGYELQKSTDMEHFTPIGWVNAQGSIHKNSYTFTDKQLAPGTTYYRVKSVDLDESVSYSRIRALAVGINHTLRIYPNPVQEGKVTINAQNLPAGYYTVTLYNQLGRVFQQERLHLNQNSCSWKFNRPLPSGTYLLQVTGENETHQVKVVVD